MVNTIKINTIDVPYDVVVPLSDLTVEVNGAALAVGSDQANARDQIIHAVSQQAKNINDIIAKPSSAVSDADKHNAVTQFHKALAGIEHNIKTNFKDNPAVCVSTTQAQIVSLNDQIMSTLRPDISAPEGTWQESIGHTVGDLTGNQHLARSIPVGLSGASGAFAAAVDVGSNVAQSMVTRTDNDGTNLLKALTITVAGTALVNSLSTKYIGEGWTTNIISVGTLVVGGAILLAYFTNDPESETGFNPYRPNANNPNLVGLQTNTTSGGSNVPNSVIAFDTSTPGGALEPSSPITVTGAGAPDSVTASVSVTTDDQRVAVETVDHDGIDGDGPATMEITSLNFGAGFADMVQSEPAPSSAG